MRFIPTRIHGPVDYVVGVILIIAPWLFGFANGGAAMWIPMLLGVAVIVYSLLTDYEWGMARALSMPAHLWLDGLGGLLLLVSPWLFGFAGTVWVPHVIVGLLEIGAALCTQLAPVRHPASTQ